MAANGQEPMKVVRLLDKYFPKVRQRRLKWQQKAAGRRGVGHPAAGPLACTRSPPERPSNTPNHPRATYPLTQTLIAEVEKWGGYIHSNTFAQRDVDAVIRAWREVRRGWQV